ncbi:unnamed protein product [Linum trigynum]
MPKKEIQRGAGDYHRWDTKGVQHEVWSGNQPFCLVNRFGVLVEVEQVDKLRKKFVKLMQIMHFPVLKGEIVLPARKKSGKDQ